MSHDENRAKWASGSFRPIHPKDQRPHAPCAICYADGDLTTNGPVCWFSCPNGHPAWMITHKAAQNHAIFLARYTTTQDRNL